MSGQTSQLRNEAGLRERLRRIIRTIVSGPMFATLSAEDWMRWSHKPGRRVCDIAQGPPRRFSPASLRTGSASIPLGDFFTGATPDKPLAAQIVRIGEELEIVALSAEASVEWQGILDQAVPPPAGRIRLYAGYLGALFGYLPTAAQVPEGGYEVEGFQPLFGLSGHFDPDRIGSAVVGCVRQRVRGSGADDRACAGDGTAIGGSMTRWQEPAMTDEPLASRSFSLDDQTAFARLSSDCNPMHLDEAFARRTQVGAPVVHGIHTSRLGGECRAASLSPQGRQHPRQIPAAALSRRTCIGPNSRAERTARSNSRSSPQTRWSRSIRLSSEPGKSASAHAHRRRRRRRADVAACRSPLRGACRPDRRRCDRRWRRPIAVSRADGLDRRFRRSRRCSRLRRLSAWPARDCTRCLPVSTSIAIAKSDRRSALAYAVQKVDARFRSLQIDVSGSGIAGRLDAFARPAPPSQPGMTEISPRVTGSPFAGQRSLIVGGSRGLGEVTAKIVAAGGGHPVITYRESQHEAERVVGRHSRRRRPMRNPALRCAGCRQANSCRQLGSGRLLLLFRDAKDIPAQIGAVRTGKAAHVPELSMPTASSTSAPRWLMTDLRKLAVFYPSTIAIDEGVSTTTEYAMAKIAGEIAGELPQRIHVQHSRHLPPPAPHSDRSDRNRRRCQRRQRVGRDAAHCI